MMDLKTELRGCAHRDNLYARALRRILELEGDCLAYQRTMDAIGKLPPEPTFAGIPLSEHARAGAYGYHPGDEA